MNKNNLIKYFVIMILFMNILFVGIVSVQSEIQTLPDGAKLNTCIDLPQTCSNCSVINITTITYPNKTVLYLNTPMTKTGSHFNYTFCNNSAIGSYVVETCSILDGTFYCPPPYSYNVTSSGLGGTNNLVFILFIIIIIYAVTFTGFFGKNEIVTILGGMFMIALGIYLFNNGIIIFQDWITQYFSIATTGLGFILAMYAAISLIGE
jgi:hypothetical protein